MPRIRKKVCRGRETESVIQSQIITALNRLRIVNNRVNSASLQAKGTGGKSRTIRCNSLNGKSDLEAWLEVKTSKGMSFGITLYIEVKSKTGKQRPSQKEFEELMKRSSQQYILARSVGDVINAICDIRDSFAEQDLTLVTGVTKDLKRFKVC